MALVALGTLLAAILSLLYYHFRTGVPPVPSLPGEIANVVALLKETSLPPAPVIYELGCGWGSLALGLAAAFPEARIIGVELSPLPYWVARLRARGQPRLSIRRGDYRSMSLEDADAVTAYLMIAPAARLAPLLDRQLRPGTAVVASAFWFRDRQPAATRGQAALYCWPARAEASAG